MTETLTTETPAATTREAVNRPGGGTGRRKEAVARVRVVPGSGQWKINGRDLATYFPNKVHQQIVTEPFRVLGLDGQYDVSPACMAAVWVVKPVPCAWGSLVLCWRSTRTTTAPT